MASSSSSVGLQLLIEDFREESMISALEFIRTHLDVPQDKMHEIMNCLRMVEDNLRVLSRRKVPKLHHGLHLPPPLPPGPDYLTWLTNKFSDLVDFFSNIGAKELGVTLVLDRAEALINELEQEQLDEQGEKIQPTETSKFIPGFISMAMKTDSVRSWLLSSNWTVLVIAATLIVIAKKNCS